MISFNLFYPDFRNSLPGLKSYSLGELIKLLPDAVLSSLGSLHAADADVLALFEMMSFAAKKVGLGEPFEAIKSWLQFFLVDVLSSGNLPDLPDVSHNYV